MKIFFAGTPEIAVKSFHAIADKFQVVGVLTNPDRPVGRKGVLTPPPIKEKALSLGLPVFQPEKLDTAFLEKVRALAPDILVTFAYGKIFKKDFLDIFTKEALNIHPSLLPLHRGASPINAAILAGDEKTGITVQRMGLKMDSGHIMAQIEFPLTSDVTALDLAEYVSEKSATLILEVLAALETISPQQQNDSKATYCTIIKKEDGFINWNESSEEIERKYRAFYPWPGIFTLCNNKNLVITKCHLLPNEVQANIKSNEKKIAGAVLGVDKKEGILIQTGDRILAVTGLKPQAKNEMDFNSFLNGNRYFLNGTILGENNETIS